jgi:hypothetical protein
VSRWVTAIDIAWPLCVDRFVDRRARSFQPGTPIVLDNASPLYSYLNGQGAVRAYVQGTDDVSHAAISN